MKDGVENGARTSNEAKSIKLRKAGSLNGGKRGDGFASGRFVKINGTVKGGRERNIEFNS